MMEIDEINNKTLDDQSTKLSTNTTITTTTTTTNNNNNSSNNNNSTLNHVHNGETVNLDGNDDDDDDAKMDCDHEKEANDVDDDKKQIIKNIVVAVVEESLEKAKEEQQQNEQLKPSTPQQNVVEVVVEEMMITDENIDAKQEQPQNELQPQQQQQEQQQVEMNEDKKEEISINNQQEENEQQQQQPSKDEIKVDKSPPPTTPPPHEQHHQQHNQEPPLPSPIQEPPQPQQEQESEQTSEEQEKQTQKPQEDNRQEEQEQKPQQEQQQQQQQQQQQPQQEPRITMNNNLFKDVRYYLINSKISNIDDVLKSNGGSSDTYITSFLTHVICDNPDDNHSEYVEAKDVFELTIVKSDWVIKSLAANALLPTDAFSPDKTRLFSNIIGLNMNLPEKLAKQVFSLIEYYGGRCEDKYRQECTHVFSIEYDSNLNYFIQNQNNDANNSSKIIKIVTPDWIIDSIEQNRLVDELKYNPKYLITNKENDNLKVDEQQQQQQQQQQQNVNNIEQDQELTNNKKSPRAISYSMDSDNFFNQNDTSLTTNNGLNDSISIDQQQQSTLSTTPKQQQQQQQQLNKQPTTPNTTLKKSRNKSQVNKYELTNGVGGGVGLNHTPNKQQKTPTNPISQTSANSATAASSSSTFNFDMNEIFQSVIDEAVNSSIRKPTPILIELTEKLTNSSDYVYTNDTQNNLLNTSFTFYNDTYCTQENSHLIKYNNCLLGCVFYIKSFETYYNKETLFEWQKVIEKYGGRVVDEYNQDEITHVLCANRFDNVYKRAILDSKRVCTQFWLEDVLEEEKLKPPWRAYHFPAVFERKDGPLKNHIISLHGFRGKEKLILKTIIYLLNGKYTSYLTKTNSLLISTLDSGAKLDKAKEWNIPIVNGIWLMELYLGNIYALNEKIDERYKILDIDHFAYDALFVLELMKPWKNLIKIKNIPNNTENNDENSPVKRFKRNSNQRNDTTTPSNKQLKNNDGERIVWHKPQSSIPIVMFTGINVNEVTQYQRDVISLGGIIAKQTNQTTHLIVQNIDRTAKLLKCINNCDYIIHIQWLIDSKNEGKFLDPNKYLIKNEDFEKKYNCCIKESLERAKEKAPIFQNLKFYLSPSARPSLAELEDIIKSAGGQVITNIPTIKQINDNIDQKLNISKYLLISAEEDLTLFEALVEKDIPIYNEEFVLSSVLRQQIEPNFYRIINTKTNNTIK